MQSIMEISVYVWYSLGAEEVNMSKIYKAEYADGEMEVFSYCNNDKEAMEEAESCEDEHGIVFNLFEVDENYDEIRTVY